MIEREIKWIWRADFLFPMIIMAPNLSVTATELDIEGVFLFTPKRFFDDRGWFSETYNASAFQGLGFDLVFVQDNHSFSAKRGTLRGFHFQKPPRAQTKLVYCVRGRVIDIAVDLRTASPTFAKYVSVELSPQDGRQLLIPAGFGHAFLTLEPDTEIIYKVTDFYSPECDTGIRWDDPTIAFPWNIEGAPFISDKDRNLPLLGDVPLMF
jgi:dTDP-4-dehydrorhamnose 3,5-epimerase